MMVSNHIENQQGGMRCASRFRFHIPTMHLPPGGLSFLASPGGFFFPEKGA
jgi:hypothetical protein